MAQAYWFTSNLFDIREGEDNETNTGCYGKALAEWLCSKFRDLGYNANVIPEDWGWCVMCVYRDYLLWIGCGVADILGGAEGYEENTLPKCSDVVWHVFTSVEIPFFMVKSIVRKWIGRLDLKSPHEKLNAELYKILNAEHEIVFCEEP